MSKLILTRGLPGSGKTTWAKKWVAEDPENRGRANRDDFRQHCFGQSGVLDYKREQYITEAQRRLVKVLLSSGLDVVVDDTNLRAKYVRQWMIFASEVGAELEFEDFPVPVETAIQRDSNRFGTPGYVGEKVIRNLAKRFVRNGELPPLPEARQDNDAGVVHRPYVPGTVQAYSFDIDGTLALMNGRSPYDPTLYHTDTLCEELAELFSMFKSHGGFALIGMSGRSEDFRESTESWLKNNGIELDALFMRPSGDDRNDAIVKSEMVDKYVSNVYDVRIHFDDRNRVVNALREKGMKVAQVAPGDF